MIARQGKTARDIKKRVRAYSCPAVAGTDGNLYDEVWQGACHAKVPGDNILAPSPICQSTSSSQYSQTHLWNHTQSSAGMHN